MSLKKGAGPKLLPTNLTITGQGATDKLEVTYHNRKQSELIERANTGASLVVYVVESWSLDFDLTEEGIVELEDEYPGMVGILMEGFHQARRKALEKN